MIINIIQFFLVLVHFFHKFCMNKLLKVNLFFQSRTEHESLKFVYYSLSLLLKIQEFSINVFFAFLLCITHVFVYNWPKVDNSIIVFYTFQNQYVFLLISIDYYGDFMDFHTRRIVDYLGPPFWRYFYDSRSKVSKLPKHQN